MTDAGSLAVIVGCPRSGTTWLHRLLLTHPDVVGPAGESFLFVALRPWTARSGGDASGWLPTGETHRELGRRFCDRLLDAFRESTGAVPEAVLVEKTPAHVHDLPAIAALYPSVHVIHLVRDGRDVAQSLAELDFGSANVVAAARAWTSALDSADAAAPGMTHYREVRYEDLVADPVTGVGGLLEWIGVDVTSVQRDAIAAEAGVRVSQYNTSGPVGPGKWRRLGAADLAAVYDVAGDALVGRGYLTAAELRRELRRPRLLLARARVRLRRRTRKTP